MPLPVICGPTASGKTRLAVDLARQLNGEVISADSMQIYRGMNIGTAKPSMEERGGVPHHLLDIVETDTSFSLADWLKHARQAVEDIRSRGRIPIVAGGTGLYIHALTDNIRFEEMDSDPQLRERLRQEAETQGPQMLWERLRDCDPELAERLHPNNLGRIIRALEVFTLTGTPMSQWQRQSRREPPPWNLCMLGLNFSCRQTLYERIDQRVDLMLESGLVEEVRALDRQRLSKTAAQAIGYKELFDYLDGKASLEEAAELIKTGTRRYAKRQLTWLRRDARIRWLDWESVSGYPELLSIAEEAVLSTLNLKPGRGTLS